MADENKFQTLEDQLKEAELKKQIAEAQRPVRTWEEERTYQEALAKNTSSEMTDIFKQQESFNQSIMKVMEGLTGGDTTPTYVTAQAPAQAEPAKSPNYMLWLGIGAIAFFLFMRKR